LGLFFSLFAWLRAKAAAQAAREAREAVRRGNAGEDLRDLTEKAKELLGSAQNEQFEAALVRSRDLLAGIGEARQRWEAFLGGESSQQIQKAASEIGRISRALSLGRQAIPPEAREKLLKSCHEAVRLLAEESGKMLKRLEGGTV